MSQGDLMEMLQKAPYLVDCWNNLRACDDAFQLVEVEVANSDAPGKRSQHGEQTPTQDYTHMENTLCKPLLLKLLELRPDIWMV